jgi:hypothetical protein
MKTGNISSAGVLLTQAKTTREEKAAAKKESNKTIEDKIDLSTTGISATSTPAPYEEVLELLYGIDYGQMKNVAWISKDGAAKIMELLQS